jgi:hypothetical protein
MIPTSGAVSPTGARLTGSGPEAWLLKELNWPGWSASSAALAFSNKADFASYPASAARQRRHQPVSQSLTIQALGRVP